MQVFISIFLPHVLETSTIHYGWADCVVWMKEREEESKRLKQQRLTEEAEAKRLANESARREEARIRKEIEEKELEEARALLAEAEKRKGKKGKKAAGDGVSFFCILLRLW